MYCNKIQFIHNCGLTNPTLGPRLKFRLICTKRPRRKKTLSFPDSFDNLVGMTRFHMKLLILFYYDFVSDIPNVTLVYDDCVTSNLKMISFGKSDIYHPTIEKHAWSVFPRTNSQCCKIRPWAQKVHIFWWNERLFNKTDVNMLPQSATWKVDINWIFIIPRTGSQSQVSKECFIDFCFHRI